VRCITFDPAYLVAGVIRRRKETVARADHRARYSLLVSLGTLGIGLIYDFWTLNSQINELSLSKQVR
jgi:hypothetical protein